MGIEKIIAGILVIIGLFYVAVPHDVHVSSGIGFGWNHTMHITFGVVLFIIAGMLYFWKQKKARPAAKRGISRRVARRRRR